MRPRHALAAASLAVLLAACTGPAPSEAARVGDESIPRAVVERALDELDLEGLEELEGDERTSQRRALVDDHLADAQRRILDLYIRRAMVRVVTEDAGVTVSAQEQDRARELLLEQVGGEDALDDVLEQAQLTREVFDEVLVVQEAHLAVLREHLLTEGLVPVREPRHILLETPEEAAVVVAELEAGADFAALASERSVDPGSAGRGGALPAAPRGSWLPAFDEAVWDAAPGTIVGPVASEAGFHVIEVVAEDEVVVGDLEQQQVDEWLTGELDARFARAIETTEVVVDPAFGVWNADPTQPMLVPAEPVGSGSS